MKFREGMIAEFRNYIEDGQRIDVMKLLSEYGKVSDEEIWRSNIEENISDVD